MELTIVTQSHKSHMHITNKKHQEYSKINIFDHMYTSIQCVKGAKDSNN